MGSFVVAKVRYELFRASRYRFEPEHAWNVVDKGPSAEDKAKARAFRAFWGKKKSELREIQRRNHAGSCSVVAGERQRGRLAAQDSQHDRAIFAESALSDVQCA